MPFALWCVVVAFALNMFSKLPVAMAMHRQPGGYDNRHPRDQQAALTGWGRRALAAHQNSFEAFPPFAVGVVVAIIAHADPQWTDRLAAVFIMARCLYIPLYLADVDRLRSLVWSVGFFATLCLYLLPWLAPT